MLGRAVALSLVFAPAAAAQEMPKIAPGALEGRPEGTDASPLQARLDAALPGATIEVEPGEYEGDLIVDKPLRPGRSKGDRPPRRSRRFRRAWTPPRPGTP